VSSEIGDAAGEVLLEGHRLSGDVIGHPAALHGDRILSPRAPQPTRARRDALRAAIASASRPARIRARERPSAVSRFSD
jgi:hypothetical protein